jgi:hypothetical protein
MHREDDWAGKSQNDCGGSHQRSREQVKREHYIVTCTLFSWLAISYG